MTTRRWVGQVPQTPQTAHDTTLWIPATKFAAMAAGPVIGPVGGGTAKPPVFLLDGTTSEGIETTVRLPGWWTTFNADLWWANATAGSGNVVFRVDRAVLADGAAVPALTTNALAAVAAPAQNTVKVGADVLGSAPAVPTASQTLILGVTRLPADVGDTLAADVGVLGLLLKRVT